MCIKLNGCCVCILEAENHVIIFPKKTMASHAESTSITLTSVVQSSILLSLKGYSQTQAYSILLHTQACKNIAMHPHTRDPSIKGWLLCDTQQVAQSTQFVEGKKKQKTLSQVDFCKSALSALKTLLYCDLVIF